MAVKDSKIRRIEFHNFKSFGNYSVALTEVNILVGPNNSGKSTVLGILRVLDVAVRAAKSRKPIQIEVGDTYLPGYIIPEDSIPISMENIATDYNDQESRVVFTLGNGNKLIIIFDAERRCILIPEAKDKVVNSVSSFKREFPIVFNIVPVLGPVEHEELLREKDTVVAGITTHRACRHFRSYWYHFPAGFEDFSRLISQTWQGMQIDAPELDPISKKLTMFCLEGRMTRELYWVGFGFQVWCQLITHICRATPESIIVVDEPEVYLHPDIQRQLLSIIRDTGAGVIMATHSSEIIAEADPSELLMVDKRKRSAERIKDIAGIQRVLDAVGSGQNISLTALARSRRVLFVEGLDDFRLYRRFARKLGLHELSTGVGLTPLESGGFGSWQRVTVLSDGVADALGSQLMIAAVYDRDYFCDEKIREVLDKLNSSLKFAAVLERKEIENYLLIPSVIERIVNREMKGKQEADVIEFRAEEVLAEITEKYRSDVLSQRIAKRQEHLKNTGADASTISKHVIAEFDAKWPDLSSRLSLVPGKEVLAELRAHVKGKFGVTLTEAGIVENINRNEFPEDLASILNMMDEYRRMEFEMTK